MKKIFNLFVIVLLIVFGAVLFASSQTFFIKQVEIIGNNRLTAGFIKETTGLHVPVNIFSFHQGRAKKNLLKNTYIESVSITKKLPDTVTINITERHLSGYIEYLKGTFLYLDDKGRVLEVASYYTEKLPVVVGLKFDEVTVGKQLEVENKNAFQTVMTLSLLFNKYSLENDVIRVDVSDSSDIHIFIYNIDVYFGSISDADAKIRYLIAILEKLPDAQTKKGFLDIRDFTRTPPRFKLLS